MKGNGKNSSMTVQLQGGRRGRGEGGRQLNTDTRALNQTAPGLGTGKRMPGDKRLSQR